MKTQLVIIFIMIFNLISCTKDQDLNDSTYKKPSEKEKEEEPINNIKNMFFIEGKSHSIRYPYFGRNSYGNNVVLRYTSHDVSNRANRNNNGLISQLNISLKQEKLSTSLTMNDIKSLHFIVPNGGQSKTIFKEPKEGFFSFKLEDRDVNGIADYYILEFVIGKRGEKDYIKGHYEGKITQNIESYIED